MISLAPLAKNRVNPASRIAGSKSRFTAGGFISNALFVSLPWWRSYPCWISS
jgi:hypothetical protein